MSSIAITICATKSYQYALTAQARSIQANISHLETGHLILVTDENPVAGILELYSDLLPGWQIHHIPLPLIDGHKNYKESAQLCISQMRSAAFSKARALKVDLCWSLDSDVLPPPNALRCMEQMLAFDGGYYGVATCPYASQGGSGFLFGRGTPQHQICEDVYEDERVIPKDLEKRLKSHRAKIDPNGEPSKDWLKIAEKLNEEIKQCPPKDNVFALNAEGWRKRGWGEQAFPAIGKGAVVPTDWCGFGCTLLSKKALDLADFIGYEGKGTEDLFVVWRKWFPNGIRIAAIPHVLCHHVIRNKDKTYTLCYAYHETEGEFVGHIRLKHLPFYSHDAGEEAIKPA